MTGGAVADVVGETDRSRREVTEAGTSVHWGRNASRGRPATSTGRWVSGEPRAGAPSSCQSWGMTPSDRRPAGSADVWCGLGLWSTGRRRRPPWGDALESNAAENEALARAWRARERGASVQERLRASSRVDAAGDEGWRRTERAVTRLTGQAEALRRYDQPVGRGR